MVSCISGACPALSFENDGPGPVLAQIQAWLPEQEARSWGDVFGAAVASQLVGWHPQHWFPELGEVIVCGAITTMRWETGPGI